MVKDMKKVTKKLVLLLCLCMLAATLAACGKDQAVVDASGTYTGQYGKYVGDSDDDKNTKDAFSIVLKDDGTGTFKRDGNEYDITKWTINGTSFTMEEKFMGMVNNYTGTLNGNSLEIFNGEPGNSFTYQYVLSK